MRSLKKLIVFIMVLTCVWSVVGCTKDNEGVVRIHIRANSNSVDDQEIKLCVRDSVIDYITPLIAECNNSEDVKDILTLHLNDIQHVADGVLEHNGYDYVSKANIRNEYFPTRVYEDNVFPADYYDALIIELGCGVGDNWWCVAYPPLCFVGDDCEGDSIKYKSKLIELINKYFG